MPRAARIDDNQHAIVEALRGAGATVESLAAVGRGVPDLLVGVKVVRDPLLELLREIEWGNVEEGVDLTWRLCPICDGLEKALSWVPEEEPGHKSDCRLAAALQQADEPTAINLLFEAKDGDKPPSKRKLTDVQVEWHVAWKGQVCVVTSPEDALAVIKEVTGA